MVFKPKKIDKYLLILAAVAVVFFLGRLYGLTYQCV